MTRPASKTISESWHSKYLFCVPKICASSLVCETLIVKPENTHLLCKGKYHCTADLLFDQLGFGQTSKSVHSFNSTKQLNPNQSNRSAVQWYFLSQSKWVFSGKTLSPSGRAVDVTQRLLPTLEISGVYFIQKVEKMLFWPTFYPFYTSFFWPGVLWCHNNP